MIVRPLFLAVATLTAMLLTAVASGAQPAASDREILPLKGDLFRVRSGEQHTVFLVTPAGIVLADPISVETAQWLRAEFERRFPPGAVRYLLYTSHRFDRASGAVIFNDRAEIIGHREFASALSKSRQREEPRYRNVRDMKSLFDTTRTITIGGATVDLVHAPIETAPENVVVVFRAQRVAFATDAPLVDQPSFSFGIHKPRDVRRWLATVSPLEFDVLLLANGRSISRAELLKLSSYVDAVVSTVAAEYEAGRSAAQFTQAKLPVTNRSDVAFRDWRANVSDAYRDVSLLTVETTIGAVGSYVQQDDAVFCASFATCSGGGGVPAGLANVSMSFGRWSAVGEFIAVEEVFSSRTSLFLDEDFALRETRGAVMLARNLPAGAFTLRLLGGMSYAVADLKGMSRIKEGLAPFAGRHAMSARDSRWAYMGGIDLVIGRRLGIVLPLRVNYATDEAKGTWPHRMDAQAGVAITVRLFRTID